MPRSSMQNLEKRRKRTVLMYRIIGLGFLALIVAWPMWSGPGLRAQFASRRLAADPNWTHAALPAISLALAKANSPDASVYLEGARSLLRTWRGQGAELSWAALALAEAKAGRPGRARQAWRRAESLNPAVRQWLTSPALAELARALEG